MGSVPSVNYYCYNERRKRSDEFEEEGDTNDV